MTPAGPGKILLFSEIFPPAHGGSGRWFSEIYQRFPQRQVVFLVGNHERASEYDSNSVHKTFREELRSEEWGIRSIKGAGFYLRLWRRLRLLVKHEGITTVHCGRALPEGFAALLLKKTHGIPYSCYVHGEDVEGALTSREFTWMTKRVLQGADHVISNSNNTYRILAEKWGLDNTKVVVMNPGVDVRRFSPCASNPTPAGWQGRTVILTVSRLQRRKGHDMMIRALPELVRQYPQLLYAIVGDGEERERLSKLVDELGMGAHVHFMGALADEEMVNAYKHCQLFVLPNRRVGSDVEGFGMVLLEAQACGKPVLAGNSGGTRETLVEGQTGVVVDCTEPEPLQKAVAALLADEAKLGQMGAEARKHVEERFGWETLASIAQRHFL